MILIVVLGILLEKLFWQNEINPNNNFLYKYEISNSNCRDIIKGVKRNHFFVYNDKDF